MQRAEAEAAIFRVVHAVAEDALLFGETEDERVIVGIGDDEEAVFQVGRLKFTRLPVQQGSGRERFNRRNGKRIDVRYIGAGVYQSLHFESDLVTFAGDQAMLAGEIQKNRIAEIQSRCYQSSKIARQLSWRCCPFHVFS